MDDDELAGGGTLIIVPEGTKPGPVSGEDATSVDLDPSTLQRAAPRVPSGPGFASAPSGPFLPAPEAARDTALLSGFGPPPPAASTPSPAFAQIPTAPPPPMGVASPPRASAPSAALPPARDSSLLQLLAIGAGAGLLVTVVVAAVVLRRAPAPAPASAPPGETSAPRGETSPSVASPAPDAVAPIPAGPSASGAAASTSDDEAAKAALGKLRDGVKRCAKDTIHALPGTSPPVPEVLAWLKHGPYTPTRRDFTTPFFACTQFKLEGPMPFLIQWQVDEPGKTGTGVAWLDPDGDGTADRAWGFQASWRDGAIEAGEIVPVAPTRKLQRAVGR